MRVLTSQYIFIGGFAHVYLVRIPVLLNNSNQHVLKRIAVGDDATLREVKKEVDVMVNR
jgi:AP2-associated kinase